MASRLTAGTLTVTITEGLTITHADTTNNIKHNKTVTASITGVANISSRVYQLKASTTHTLISFASDPTSGKFDTEDFKYMRITNLDDTNAVNLCFTDASDAAISIQLNAGQSYLVTALNIDGNASGSTITSCPHFIENAVVVTGGAETDVEIVVATA